MNEPVFDARVFKYRSSTNSSQMGVEPKIGDFTPQMDGENNGKPYEQMDDLGVSHPYFWFNTQIVDFFFLWLGVLGGRVLDEDRTRPPVVVFFLGFGVRGFLRACRWFFWEDEEVDLSNLGLFQKWF